MDISGLNRPVEFYNKNTGNNIGYVPDKDNSAKMTNIFSPGPMFETTKTGEKTTVKRKRKNKRLNTVDSDYIPDEIKDETDNTSDDNFFMGKKEKFSYEKIKKAACEILINIPLVNYFLLKDKERDIKNTIKSLNDISQNMDDLMNMAIPSGEEAFFYENIAKNLTNAASIIGKSNKELGQND